MDTTREPDTYVIQRVSFGDNPSGTIATDALRKIADMGKIKYPEAAQVINNDTYMDEIIGNMDNREKANRLTDEVEKSLAEGGFKIKGWTYSNDIANTNEIQIPTDPSAAMEKVLEVVWDPTQDEFQFKVNLTKRRKFQTRKDITSKPVHTKTPDIVTKRMILSQINSIYDPLGLVSPCTVRA